MQWSFGQHLDMRRRLQGERVEHQMARILSKTGDGILWSMRNMKEEINTDDMSVA
jgi:hypothetical protein